MVPEPRPRLFTSWYVVGLFACLGIVSIIDRIALSLLIQPMKADLGISDTQAGLLLGPAFALIYSLSAMPIAWGLDKYNRKRIAVTGIALWSASTALSAFASNFEQLFALRMGVGIGEAVLNPVIVSLIGDLFVRERRPTPTSVFMSAQTLGGSLAFLSVAALIDAWTSNAFGVSPGLAGLAPWRVALFLIGAPGLVLAFILAVSVKEPRRGAMDQLGSGESAPSSSAFGDRRSAARFYTPFILGINCIGMMLIISVSWIPTYLIRTFHAPVSHVGYLFGNALLISCAGTLAWPILAERAALRGRLDSMLVLVLVLVPCAGLAFGALLLSPSLIAAIIFVGLFHTLANGIIVMPSVVISAIGGAGARARLVAAHLFVQALLAYTFGPVIVPFLSDHVFGSRLDLSMRVVALITFPLALLLLLLSWKPYRAVVWRKGSPAIP